MPSQFIIAGIPSFSGNVVMIHPNSLTSMVSNSVMEQVDSCTNFDVISSHNFDKDTIGTSHDKNGCSPPKRTPPK